LAVVFQMFTAAPAAADSTAATGAGAPLSATASDNAEAMAGLTGDGLTSRSDHGLPSPGPTGQILDTDGLVPTAGANGPSAPGTPSAVARLPAAGPPRRSAPGLPSPGPTGPILDAAGLVPTGGANGPFGPGMGDVARSGFAPRIDVRLVTPAYVQSPVVRAAADDPSFSPD